jgi:NAD(P)-dependent dehydrogenase (short-subunit alcohol dehydrogenase family)
MGLACARRLVDAVDVLLLVDRDEASVLTAAHDLSGRGAQTEAVALDITDAEGLARLADRVAQAGTLRAVAHAAGISPTMADWRRIFTVDIVGTAMLAEALRPLATTGTAMVCFASMAPLMGITPNEAADAALDEPLAPDLLDRIHDALGPSIEDTGMAYSWAKRGVHRFVRQEAVRLGAARARICSVSPGLIDTPQGRQEAQVHPIMQQMVDMTPLGRMGDAEEVAAVVNFLLSDEASFLNGIDVLIDGGVVAAMGQAGQLPR